MMLTHSSVQSVLLAQRSTVSPVIHIQRAKAHRALAPIAPWNPKPRVPGVCHSTAEAAVATPVAKPAPAKAAPVELEVGQVYNATVTSIAAREAVLDIQGRSVKLAGRNVSRVIKQDLTTVFTVGEVIKVLVTGNNPAQGPWVSTKVLETEPGLILTDKKAVFDGAEKVAEQFRAEGVVKRAARQEFFDKLKVGDVIKAEFKVIDKNRMIFKSQEGQTLTTQRTRVRALGRLKSGQTYELHVLGKLDSGYPILGAPLQPESASSKPASEAAPQPATPAPAVPQPASPAPVAAQA